MSGIKYHLNRKTRESAEHDTHAYYSFVGCKKVGFLLQYISLVTDFVVGVDVHGHQYSFYRITKSLPSETVLF